MSFVNPYSQNQQHQSSLPHKLSIIYIQQAYFHRIQIKSLSSIYKLNVKLKKPVVLSLYTLPVVKYIKDHSETINSIIQIQNIQELKISVSGYGIFNQKYQLSQISNLFLTLAKYGENIWQNMKKLTIEFPGWRTFSSEVISNIFQFIKKCKILEELSLNLNYAMNLHVCEDKNNEQKIQNEMQTFYGQHLFGPDQFELLMKYATTILPRSTLSKLEFRFGAWQCVSTEILEKLISYLSKLYEKFKNLKSLKLDLHGWGKGSYASEDDQIKNQVIQNLFKMIEQIDGDSSELLEIDMRHWPQKYNIQKYKERFMYLNGGWKKREEGQNSNLWSMTGTVFFGSQLRSKLPNKIRVQIMD